MVTWLKINGVTMPTPKSFQILRADLDSDKSSRSEAGYMKRDRVRADTRKFTLSWTLKESDMIFLLSYLSLVEFTAEVYDATIGGYAQYTMYAGDRTADLIKWNPENPSENWYTVSCNLIEY
jgi:hypothetical protein